MARVTFFQNAQQLVLLMCCLLNSSSIILALDCFEPDIQALRSFSQHLIFSPISWSPASNACCSWEGITCTAAAMTPAALPRVSGLRLSDVNFSRNFHFPLEPLCNLSLLTDLFLREWQSSDGVSTQFVPACLGHLSALRSLSLSLSSLQGPLPTSFSRLLHLQHLDLSQSSGLSGALFPISNLPNLTYVDLSFCNFSGPLPPFHAPLLQLLDLSDNFYLNSTLLDFTLLSHLPSLTTLALLHSSISGAIPASIARLSNLVSLDLGFNLLSGELPHSFCKLANLQYLNLEANLLSGNLTLDSWECMFRNLTFLDLSANGFTGPFPHWIGHSPSLQGLILGGGNKLQGPLPDEWPNFQNLAWLDLSGNSPEPSHHLHNDSTRLPNWIFRSPLQHFHASSCGLQTHDILCGGKLSLLNQSLQELSLDDNHLTGRDTLECFQLHNFSQAISLSLSGNPLFINLSDVLLPPLVSSLDLESCGLQGHVPKAGWLFAFDMNVFILHISLANNSLIGSLPMQIFNSSLQFKYVDFSYNHFNGVDPLLISDPVSYFHMDFSHNALAMDFRSFLATIGLMCNGNSSNDPYFQDVDLSHNALVGEIPSSLGLCNKALARMKIDNNNLVGQIPEELSGLASIWTLTLSNNSLKGTIPASVIAISSLRLLDLSYNELEGNLSSLFSFSSATHLRVVLLSHNRISGSIPPSFGTFMPNLQLIDFSNNRLTGIIPQELHLPYFKNLKATDMGSSTSTVSLYEDIQIVVKGLELPYTYELKVMISLDLSANYLEGAIPEEMGDLAGLIFLNLSHNNLSGGIPSSLAKLSQLQSLDLSSNQLEGPLPSQVSNLTKLSDFDVSFNAGLWGRIPQGPQLESTDSYRGDPLLCGFPTLQDCKLVNSSDIPTTVVQQPASSRRNIIARWMDEWISVPGLGLGIFVGFATTLCLLHYRDVKALLTRTWSS